MMCPFSATIITATISVSTCRCRSKICPGCTGLFPRNLVTQQVSLTKYNSLTYDIRSGREMGCDDNAASAVDDIGDGFGTEA